MRQTIRTDERPFLRGDLIRDQEGETAHFLKYSTTDAWGYFNYGDAGTHKLPISGLKLVEAVKS